MGEDRKRLEALSDILQGFEEFPPPEGVVDAVFDQMDEAFLDEIERGDEYDLERTIWKMYKQNGSHKRMDIAEEYYQRNGALLGVLEYITTSACKDFSELAEVVERMRILGHRPGRGAFWGAVRKVAIEDAHEFISLMRRYEIDPDTTVFKNLSQRSRRFEDRLSIYRLMREAQIKPDSSFFKGIAEVAVAKSEREKLMEAVDETKTKLEPTFFQSLVQSTKTFDERMEILKTMETQKVKPNISIFKVIAEMAKTEADRKTLMDALHHADVQPDPPFFQSLVQGAKTFEDRMQVLDVMRGEDVEPSIAVFRPMAELARNPVDRLRLLEVLRDDQVQPDPPFFQSLVQSAGTFEERMQVLDVMRALEVTPSAGTYLVLIQSAGEAEQARELLEDMREDGWKPQGTHLSAAIGACATLEEAREYIREIEEIEETPNAGDIIRLMKKAPNASEADSIYQALPTMGIEANANIFNLLISKQSEYESAWALVRGDRPNKHRIDQYTLNPLLRLAQTYSHAEEVLEAMSMHRIIPDSYSVAALLSSGLAESEMVEMLRKMREMGLEIVGLDASLFGRNGPRFEALRKQLDG